MTSRWKRVADQHEQGERAEPTPDPTAWRDFPRDVTEPLATVALLWQGPGDPQMRLGQGFVARTTWTRAGAATVLIEDRPGSLRATAWGPGAEAALDLVPGLVGALDDPSPLAPLDPVVAELMRRSPGIRLTRAGSAFEVLVPTILAQKVTGLEARRAHRALLNRFGERAPGPLGLVMPPPPARLARLPYWAYHPLGIERRRADAIRAAAAAAPELEAMTELPPSERRRRLLSLPGIGDWTAAETARLAFGDPDAVSVGDFHLPRLVCSVLAGEADGDDARMLELLEPYRGQRARVALLIERSGIRQQRRAPRMAPRSIAAI